MTPGRSWFYTPRSRRCNTRKSAEGTGSRAKLRKGTQRGGAATKSNVVSAYRRIGVSACWRQLVGKPFGSKRCSRKSNLEGVKQHCSGNQISVVMERRGFGKSGGCKTKPHQDHTAFQRVSIANLDNTSRPFLAASIGFGFAQRFGCCINPR